jgi:hypothetical protein
MKPANLANSATTPMTSLVLDALSELPKRRPIFHSESDFQHELAMEISRLYPTIEIRLERPIRMPDGRSINLDLLLHLGDNTLAVELKYVTARLDAVVRGEEFSLKAQSAQDIRRYEIIKDISRIEVLCSQGIVNSGISITLTNDRSLWSEARRPDTVDAMFRLHHGRVLGGNLVWAAEASAGTVRGREHELRLSGEYFVDWKYFSTVETPTRSSEFRILTVEIGPNHLAPIDPRVSKRLTPQ